MKKRDPFKYFKTSPEIIRLAVMLYIRFPLSLRNVEDLLHERGIGRTQHRIDHRRRQRGILGLQRAEFRAGAQGVRIEVSGRLGGAEIARTEWYREGRVPLHTFRADIDYHVGEALTKMGMIGIKVWICKGEVYGKRDLSAQFAPRPSGKQGQGGKPQRGGRKRK